MDFRQKLMNILIREGIWNFITWKHICLKSNLIDFIKLPFSIGP